jgi:aerobic carbon-monoxide dehydrogenase medium subunit
VKPPPFDYARPESIDEALALLADAGDEASVLAGGQSLVPLLNMRMAQPRLVVDVNRVAGLDTIESVDGHLRLGATVRQRTLETDPLVGTRLPLVADATQHIAHIAIRSRGTVGGSLAHADPAAELPAVAVAMGARLHLRSAAGERTVDADSFFEGPLMTARRPDELLTAVELPAPPPGTGWAFLEVARTHGAFALVGAAAQLHLGPTGRIDAAGLALCGVGPSPYRAAWLHGMVVGEPPAPGLYRAVAERVRAEVEPLSDVHASPAYRRQVSGVLTARVLAAAAERATARGEDR